MWGNPAEDMNSTAKTDLHSVGVETFISPEDYGAFVANSLRICLQHRDKIGLLRDQCDPRISGGLEIGLNNRHT